MIATVTFKVGVNSLTVTLGNVATLMRIVMMPTPVQTTAVIPTMDVPMSRSVPEKTRSAQAMPSVCLILTS